MEATVRYPVGLEGIVFEDQGEGLIVVLDPAQGLLLLTNAVGRRVLELADGSRTAGAIQEALLTEFEGAEPARVKADVEGFLQRAQAKGVIQWRN